MAIQYITLMNKRFLLPCLLFVWLAPTLSFAQNIPDPEKEDKRGTRNVYWAEAGFGMSNEGWVGEASLHLETIKGLLLVGGISNLSKGDLKPQKTYFERESFFLGLGYVNKKGVSLKVISASLSFSDFTQGVFSGVFDQFGVPVHDINQSSVTGLRLDAKVIPNNGWVGLSFNPFVDINSRQTIIGATTRIALGRMW